MLFSSITFLYFFLPLALLIYKVVPSGAKNLCLCMISCLFYAWGEPAGLFLMLGQVVFAYILTGIADNRKGTVIGRISYILSVFVPFVFSGPGCFRREEEGNDGGGDSRRHIGVAADFP